MATARNGQPSRGVAPSRQNPAPARHGRGAGDPTEEGNQAPASIFGIPVPEHTGAQGSAGGTPSSDVTVQPGQLDDGLAGVTRNELTDTGAPGGSGTVPHGGGEAVSYTPPGYADGGPFRDASAQGTVSGTGDWTQANSDGYAAGPTLPGLENNRPTSTGAGRGRSYTPKG